MSPPLYDSLIQTLTAISYNPISTPKRSCDSGAGSPQMEEQAANQCTQVAPMAYLNFSIPCPLWSEGIKFLVNQLDRSRSAAENSPVIQSPWFKTTDFILATRPAMMLKILSVLSGLYPSLSTALSQAPSVPFSASFHWPVGISWVMRKT